MTATVVALLPVFLVILLGSALRRSGLVSDTQWQAVGHVAYWVLFPALIFKEIAKADFSGIQVFDMSLAMMLAVAVMSALLLAARKALSGGLAMDGPAYASLFQGATRWHTFIALAIIPVFAGSKGLALGAVGVAAMTPMLNVINSWVHAQFASAVRLDARQLALSIACNPFVFASLGGVAWHLLRLPLPWPAFDVLDILGKAALGLALLDVGAGLRFELLRAGHKILALAAALKLIAMPVLMSLCLQAFAVTGDAALVALLCAAVPTGSGAYVLARQMGGDAPLMANILTTQVIAAAFTIPLMLWLLG